MRVAIRTDASCRIGSGHLVRCLTLADALRAKGAQVQFVSRPHDLPVADRIHAAGFRLRELPAAADRPRGADGDYAAWLGVPQRDDAEQTLRAIGDEGVDLLVVDHYGLDASWETRLTDVCGRMLVLDDLADREHAADVLVDQNLRSDGAYAYAPLVPDSCQVLSGPSYALIRDEYVHARRRWRDHNDASRALITLGGVDDPALFGVIVDGLSDLAGQLESVDVVVADPELIRDRFRPSGGGLTLRLHGPQPHLAHLMAQAHIAIGAGGGTTWERLCVGLPTAVVSRAANQRRGLRELAALDAVIDLGDATELTPKQVRDAVEALLASDDKQRRMHELGQALVDGHGTRRVVESIMPTDASALTLREARTDDRGILWMWANDRTVREQSLNRAAIGWEPHLAWFERTESDPNIYLLVLEAEGLPVGQIRIDLDDGRATVNYALDAAVRGRGWGRQIIQMGLEWLRDQTAASRLEIIAIVQKDNPASSKVFERLGFTRDAAKQDGQRVLRYTRLLDP